MIGEDRDDGARHLFLSRKDVLQLAIVPIGPTMTASQDVDQLRGNSNTLSATANAAFEQVAHIQLSTDLADIDCLALVGEG